MEKHAELGFKIQLGKRYPDEDVLAVLENTDGVTFNPFLGNDCPAPLLLNLANIHPAEQSAFDNGDIKFGFTTDGFHIVGVFDIGGINYECPINMFRLQGNHEIPEKTEDIRLLVNMTAIESTTGNVAAIRVFTLHPETSKDLIDACNDQLENGCLLSVEEANMRASLGWKLSDLADKCDLKPVGV